MNRDEYKLNDMVDIEETSKHLKRKIAKCRKYGNILHTRSKFKTIDDLKKDIKDRDIMRSDFHRAMTELETCRAQYAELYRLIRRRKKNFKPPDPIKINFPSGKRVMKRYWLLYGY